MLDCIWTVASRSKEKYPSPFETGEALPGMLHLVLGLLKKEDTEARVMSHTHLGPRALNCSRWVTDWVGKRVKVCVYLLAFPRLFDVSHACFCLWMRLH